MYTLDDTIAAIATAPGEGGIAVVRVSGSTAGEIGAEVLRGRDGGTLALEPRRAHVARAVDPESGGAVDEVLALWMPGPGSYTREDVLELQCHGGRAAARAILRAVLKAGARVAEPGEFTLRAYLRGRIDLIQAEGVLDVIRARGEEALRVHERLMEGRLSREIASWQERLGEVLVPLELVLDFAEAGEEVDEEAAASTLAAVVGEMRGKLAGARFGQACREGFDIALVGSPNAGKSSLLNRLLDEDRAIVSEAPGTTRDVVEGWLGGVGVPVRLLDTAGLRRCGDGVEAEGVRRARAAARAADLVLFVCDGERGLDATEEGEAVALCRAGRCVPVVNKVDRGRIPAGRLEELFGRAPWSVSALTGEGISELLDGLRARVAEGTGGSSEAPLTRERQRTGVARALECLERAAAGLAAGAFPELVASDVHAARRHLGELLGWGAPEDVVEHIFREFCIGK